MQTKVVIGVDIAKTVFEIAVSPEPGSIIQRERLKRACFLAFFVNRPPALVAMEACGSAPWARQIQALDHEVRLLRIPAIVSSDSGDREHRLRGPSERSDDSPCRPTGQAPGRSEPWLVWIDQAPRPCGRCGKPAAVCRVSKGLWRAAAVCRHPRGCWRRVCWRRQQPRQARQRPQAPRSEATLAVSPGGRMG